MPTYVYKCPQCGKVFERFHAMSENPEVVCPECGVKAEREISGGAGFIMKGSETSTGCCGNENPCQFPKRCCENQ